MIKNILKNCLICQKNKNLEKPKNFIWIKTNEPMEMWEIDMIGPLQLTERGNRYIISIIDHYSKYGYAFSVASKSAENVVLRIKEIFEKAKGIPKRILTDNGLEFANSKFAVLARNYNIELRKSSPYHPQTTGAVERFNQTLMNKLRKITNFGEKEWDESLEAAVLAYNISFSRPLGMSPYEYVHEMIPICAADKELIRNSKLNLRIQKDELKKVPNNIKKYREQFGEKTKINKFKVGDKILYYNPVAEKGKLNTCWSESGIIVKEEFGSYLFRNEMGEIKRSNEMYLRLL